MATVDTPESRDARHGAKMIEVKVRFWTDSITNRQGRIVPKHALTGGIVRLTTNDVHGIKASKAIPFNSLLDLPSKIEKLLIRDGIKLHLNRQMVRYVQPGRS
jgi:hypothetical protein